MAPNQSPRNKAPFGSVKTNSSVKEREGSSLDEGSSRSPSKEGKSRSVSPGIPTSPGFNPKNFDHITKPVYVFGELDPVHINEQKRKLACSVPKVGEIEEEVRDEMKNASPEVK